MALRFVSLFELLRGVVREGGACVCVGVCVEGGREGGACGKGGVNVKCEKVWVRVC